MMFLLKMAIYFAIRGMSDLDGGGTGHGFSGVRNEQILNNVISRDFSERLLVLPAVLQRRMLLPLRKQPDAHGNASLPVANCNINANLWIFYGKCRKNGEFSLKNDVFLLKNGRFFCNLRYQLTDVNEGDGGLGLIPGSHKYCYSRSNVFIQ